MQTFLPYPNFIDCAKCLDWRRLGKQRVEAMQILRQIQSWGTPGMTGWKHHPAVLMWLGHEEALENYAHAMVQEWVRRGYKNTLSSAFYPYAKMPPWLGNERLHASHQSNLVRKLPSHYSGIFPGTLPGLPYFWPVRIIHGSKVGFTDAFYAAVERRDVAAREA